MSLGVVIKGPEGIVLACDSRVTLTATKEGSPSLIVNYDNATKLLSLAAPHNYVAAVTYGIAVIGLRTAHSFIPEFEVELEESKDRLTMLDFANKLSKFYLTQWKKAYPEEANIPPMVFIVGGYDPGDAYGKVYQFDIPYKPDPIEQNPGEENFGMTWGGQLDIASRIIHGYDPNLLLILQKELNLSKEQVAHLTKKLMETLEFSIPYQILPLQDCIDLATFMIRTTINGQNLAVGIRGVGGPIDVAIVTKTNGLQYIQKKTIKISENRI